MKTIFNHLENQIEGTETLPEGIVQLNEGTERIFTLMKNRPSLVIWLIWIVITGVDLIIRLIGAIPLASFPAILVNFAGGVAISQFLFFHFLPRVFLKKKWLLEFVQLILILVVYMLAKYFILMPGLVDVPSIRAFFGNEATRFFHFSVYIIVIWFFYIDGKRQELHKKMEVEHLRLETEHKSSQLSQHFVLNWISTFLIEVKNVSPDLAHKLSKFTEVLSYSYKDPNHPNSLGQEIRVVKSYLESQQFRFKEKLNLKFSINLRGIDPGEFQLPKWILMTLVENVFKHGNCLNSLHPCLISMDMFPAEYKGYSFAISISNDLNRADPVRPSGFGVKTVRRILNYYFQDRFQLFTAKSEAEFNLFLQIHYGQNHASV
ncbi:histidine kinase [Algoriphagus aestuariicola]|uniref:Histidine kinase n=1 Tax=Algoriphagus aestuariicola TaxID=1852016 RepID=A0ABS3BLH9_9BACT|nr:histidine kinase [Algoriphagus aestuariicola]MBN7800154.1 histidine kinase [Algoriphagus aestuariicola]